MKIFPIIILILILFFIGCDKKQIKPDSAIIPSVIIPNNFRIKKITASLQRFNLSNYYDNVTISKNIKLDTDFIYEGKNLIKIIEITSDDIFGKYKTVTTNYIYNANNQLIERNELRVNENNSNIQKLTWDNDNLIKVNNYDIKNKQKIINSDVPCITTTVNLNEKGNAKEIISDGKTCSFLLNFPIIKKSQLQMKYEGDNIIELLENTQLFGNSINETRNIVYNQVFNYGEYINPFIYLPENAFPLKKWFLSGNFSLSDLYPLSFYSYFFTGQFKSNNIIQTDQLFLIYKKELFSNNKFSSYLETRTYSTSKINVLIKSSINKIANKYEETIEIDGKLAAKVDYDVTLEKIN
jgi:hypothetical protein